MTRKYCVPTKIMKITNLASINFSAGVLLCLFMEALLLRATFSGNKMNFKKKLKRKCFSFYSNRSMMLAENVYRSPDRFLAFITNDCSVM